MTRLKKVCLSLLLVLVVSTFVYAQATPEQAEALVKKAIEYYKVNGKDKAFAEMNNPSGQFVKDDLYVFVYDLNGRCLVHGYSPKLVGMDLINLKDHDGRYFVRERISLVKVKVSGWQEWKYKNPVTNNIELKTIYVEKIGNYLFGSGRILQYKKLVTVWR